MHIAFIVKITLDAHFSSEPLKRYWQHLAAAQWQQM